VSGLQRGWTAVPLQDVCELLNGRAYKQTELLSEGKYPVLRVGNFFSNRNWYYSDLELEPNKYCDSGDLLYAWSASFGPKIWDGGKVIYHYHIWKTQPNEAVVDKMFLHHWFEWDKENIKAEHGTGSTMIHVTKGDMECRSLHLPPLPEQRRIVARIDSLSAKSRRARDHLDQIPRLVAKYKQAVVAAAFRGELTHEWRQKRPIEKTGNDLRRDLLDLKQEWERRIRPGKQVFKPDFSREDELHKLPRSWTWIPVEAISTKVTDGVHKKPNYVDDGVPFLTVKNLTAGSGISFDNCKFVTRLDHAEFIKRTHPEEGDILITKDGTLGTVRAIRTKSEFSIFVSLALVKPLIKGMTDYLELAFQAPQLQDQMVGVGSGLQHIHLNDLRRDLIPVAPADERSEIVRRVRTAFAWIDRLSSEATSARKLIDHLDQAILAKAFRGQLVPQSPNDEPASVVLERIREERQAAPKNRRGRRAKAEI
jgi:type I restriction enzyme, S subunit